MWMCKECLSHFEANEFGKISHDYGGIQVTENVCPVCGSRLITCLDYPMETRITVDRYAETHKPKKIIRDESFFYSDETDDFCEGYDDKC